jgi:hypothetical protein
MAAIINIAYILHAQASTLVRPLVTVNTDALGSWRVVYWYDGESRAAAAQFSGIDVLGSDLDRRFVPRSTSFFADSTQR